MIKVGLISLGCAKNLVDSEVMLGVLQQKGFMITEDQTKAEVLVVNTCGFIESAKEESINTILEMANFKTEGNCKVLIVTGCLAQKYKDELLNEMPEIDGILGTGDITGIAEVIQKALAGERNSSFNSIDYLYDHITPRMHTTPGYTAYIKIAEGCNNRCSYCIIPELRGPLRSRPIESIVSEVKELAKNGVKEVILIAQDTTCYGEDLYKEHRLSDLLHQLNDIDGLAWIRIMYAYPTYFNEQLVEAISTLPKVCKYIDIPLQHINDEILRLMHRKGNKEEILELLQKLRDKIPAIALRTSIIVGFPGETEEQFNELLDFVQETEFDRLGVFTYSREDGTPAAEMLGQIPEDVKKERMGLLMELQQQISLKKNQDKIGKIINVLIEGKSEDNPELYLGRTEYDAPEIDGLVYVKGENLEAGGLVSVLITHAYEYDLTGEVI